MNLSKPLSVLILIASVFLLSAARNVTAEGPSQANQQTQTETPAQQHDTVTSPSPTVINEETAEPIAASGATNIYNQYKQSSPWGDFPTWLEAIATIGLLVFAGWQIAFIRRTTKATEDSAKAASENAVAAKDAAEATKKYAEVATRAFVSERPILIVVRMEQDPKQWGRHFRPSIYVRNCGNKPAIIERCTTNTCKDDSNIPTAVGTPDYERGGEVPLQRTVLSSNEEMTIAYGVRMLSESEAAELLTMERRLVIFGKIWYRDPSGAWSDPPYTCPFYWYYSPPAVVWDNGGFYRGPKHLNQET